MEVEKTNFVLRSPAFQFGAEIPQIYTCEGKNISPPLAWSEPPSGTQTFALIVDDPDAPDPRAPERTWVHWLLYNIPGGLRSLPEALAELPESTEMGTNDWKINGYGGPCPPIGRHHYHFKLYALNAFLRGLKNPTKAELFHAFSGHIMARTELVGTYIKKASQVS